MKVDLSDGFYRVNLNIDDIPKLGVAFPTEPGQEPLIALPLVLPMGWKNSPPNILHGHRNHRRSREPANPSWCNASPPPDG